MTIPRVGLTLAGGTQIRKESCERPVKMGNEQTDLPGENFSLPTSPEHENPTQTDNTGETESLTLSPAAQLAVRPVRPSLLNRATQKLSLTFIMWTAGLGAITLLAFILWFSRTVNENHDYFNSYILLAKEGDCHIFVADNNLTSEDKVRTLSLAKSFEKSCRQYPWVYITYYSMLPRTSILRCTRQMSEKNSCISEYYFKGFKQRD